MWEGPEARRCVGCPEHKKGREGVEMQEEAAMSSQQWCKGTKVGIPALMNLSERECGQGCQLPLLSVLPFLPDLRTLVFLLGL